MIKFLLPLFCCFLLNPLKSQDLDYVKEQLQVLTSDSLAGRGYVENGMQKAAAYLQEQFVAIGLKPVAGAYSQHFAFPVNTFPEETVVLVDGKKLQEGEDYILDPRSGSCEGEYEILKLDSASILRFKSRKLKSTQVLVIDGRGINEKEELDKLHSLTYDVIKTSPVIMLKAEKLTWSVAREELPNPIIEVKAESFPLAAKQVKLNISNRLNHSFEAENVIGMVEGKRADSTMVFTAHYDHLGKMGNALFRGASDNGSGTAMLLDLAKHYQQNQPEFNTVFIAFAAEEAGLIGSRFFVEYPMIDLNKIKLLINIDLMGSAEEGITVVNGRIFPELMAAMGKINEEGELLPKIKSRGKAANSDHYWFTEAGVPAVFIYTMGNIKAYHDIHDVPSLVHFDNYEQLFTLLTKFVQTL